MPDKTKNLKGNGQLTVSNVNSVASECITLTYTINNFKSERQIMEVKNAIYDLVDEKVTFDKAIHNWAEDDESYSLKAKIKSCNNEKKAHRIKAEIDEIIRQKGGQTVLTEHMEDSEK